MKNSHSALTLRGDSVSQGIAISGGQIQFNPRWGIVRRETTGLLASTAALDGDLQRVYVAVVRNKVVLEPCDCDVEPTKELVLIQQYSTGSGAKRWPGFYVELGPEVRQLASASTSCGSGSESWILISAPLGWAQNIAGQFVNERDCGDQTISYKPQIANQSLGNNIMAGALKRAGLR